MRKFTTEFKQQAIGLVLEQKVSVSQVASDLNVGLSTLGKWISDHRKNHVMPDQITESERDELKRLRKEVNVLKIERDLLKKTAVYFAKTSTPGAN